jgi:hypothetical protein
MLPALTPTLADLRRGSLLTFLPHCPFVSRNLPPLNTQSPPHLCIAHVLVVSSLLLRSFAYTSTCLCKVCIVSRRRYHQHGYYLTTGGHQKG